jgi:hypothetical protein
VAHVFEGLACDGQGRRSPIDPRLQLYQMIERFDSDTQALDECRWSGFGIALGTLATKRAQYSTGVQHTALSLCISRPFLRLEIHLGPLLVVGVIHGLGRESLALRLRTAGHSRPEVPAPARAERRIIDGPWCALRLEGSGPAEYGRTPGSSRGKLSGDSAFRREVPRNA